MNVDGMSDGELLQLIDDLLSSNTLYHSKVSPVLQELSKRLAERPARVRQKKAGVF